GAGPKAVPGGLEFSHRISGCDGAEFCPEKGVMPPATGRMEKHISAAHRDRRSYSNLTPWRTYVLALDDLDWPDCWGRGQATHAGEGPRWIHRDHTAGHCRVGDRNLDRPRDRMVPGRPVGGLHHVGHRCSLTPGHLSCDAKAYRVIRRYALQRGATKFLQILNRVHLRPYLHTLGSGPF